MHETANSWGVVTVFGNQSEARRCEDKSYSNKNVHAIEAPESEVTEAAVVEETQELRGIIGRTHKESSLMRRRS